MATTMHGQDKLIDQMRGAIGGMFPGLANELEKALGGIPADLGSVYRDDLDPKDWCMTAAAGGGRSSIALSAPHILEYKRARLRWLGVPFSESYTPTAGWHLVVLPPELRDTPTVHGESAERRALAELVKQVRAILDDLGPGGYLLPAGASKTNALESICNEAAAVLNKTP